MARVHCPALMQAKPVGKERQKTTRLIMGVAIQQCICMCSRPRGPSAETQKLSARRSLETAVDLLAKCLCS